MKKCYEGKVSPVAERKRGDCMKNKWLHMIAFVLVIIGGVNWAIFGLFTNADGTGIDLIELLFSSVPTLAEIIYVLVGASAVYLAVTHTSECKVCSAK